MSFLPYVVIGVFIFLDFLIINYIYALIKIYFVHIISEDPIFNLRGFGVLGFWGMLMKLMDTP